MRKDWMTSKVGPGSKRFFVGVLGLWTGRWGTKQAYGERGGWGVLEEIAKKNEEMKKVLEEEIVQVLKLEREEAGRT